MVRHLKRNRAQVHLAVSKMSPEHLCWAVAERELTKDKRDTGGHEGPWAKDCRSACALAVQVLPRLRLSQPNSVLNLTKYRNGFFFSPTHWQVLFGPMYLEQGHSKLGSAFSRPLSPVFWLQSSLLPAQRCSVPTSWLGCSPEMWGVTLKAPCLRNHPLSRQQELKGRQDSGLFQYSWPTSRSGFGVMISLLPSSVRHLALEWGLMFYWDDYRTRIKTDLQCFFALELPSGIKTI